MNASELRLYHRLQVAARVMQKSADRQIRTAARLTTSQAAVLAVIGAGQDVTQRHVADALKLNESAVTAMVTRLIKLGYVGRVRSTRDKRIWILQLRHESKLAIRGARESFRTINASIDSCLTALELRRLVGYLDRLTAAFDGSSCGA